MADAPPIHLCIGAPRTGTTWLYETLWKSDAVFVPTVKEVRYWWEPRKPEAVRRVEQRSRERCGDDPDQHAWLDRWMCVQGATADEYQRLMRHPTLPSVDISPGYVKAPDRIFPELRAALSEASRIMMIVRNPFERSSSEVMLHAFMHGRARGPLPDDAVKEFLERYNHRVIRNYHAVVRRWSEVFRNQFRVFDFGELKRSPTSYLARTAEFLELDLEDIRADESAIGAKVNSSSGAKSAGIIQPRLTQSQRRHIAEISLKDARAYSEIDPELSNEWVQEIEAVLDGLDTDQHPTGGHEGVEAQLLRVIESLGGSLDIARLQRSFGYEPQSLLRWCTSPASDVHAFLSNPTAPMPSLEFAHSEAAAVPSVEQPQTPHEADARAALRATFFADLRKKPGLYVIGCDKSADSLGRDLLALLRTRNAKHQLMVLERGETVAVHRIDDGYYKGTLPDPSSNAHEVYSELLKAMAEQQNILSITDRLFV